MITVIAKDPDAILDYGFIWDQWLGADTIVSSSMIVEPGLVLDSDSNTTTTTTAWLSGGTAGEIYSVTNRITTAAGRTDDRTIKIKVIER